MRKLHLREENKFLCLHKTYLIIIAICGLPFAVGGMLLAIPATIDLSPAVLLLLTPAGLVLWDFILLIRNNKIKRLKGYLIAFYIITGITSLLASFMTYDRDGTNGFIFNPIIAVPVTIFFMVPIIALIIEKQDKSTNKKQLSNQRAAAPDLSVREKSKKVSIDLLRICFRHLT